MLLFCVFIPTVLFDVVSKVVLTVANVYCIMKIWCITLIYSILSVSSDWLNQ